MPLYIPGDIPPLGVVVALLGLVFLIKGAVPRWRAKWNWGRGGIASISLPGHLGIGLSFFVLAFATARKPSDWDPAFDVFLLLLAFVIFISAGIYDTTRRPNSSTGHPDLESEDT